MNRLSKEVFAVAAFASSALGVTACANGSPVSAESRPTTIAANSSPEAGPSPETTPPTNGDGDGNGTTPPNTGEAAPTPADTSGLYTRLMQQMASDIITLSNKVPGNEDNAPHSTGFGVYTDDGSNVSFQLNTSGSNKDANGITSVYISESAPTTTDGGTQSLNFILDSDGKWNVVCYENTPDGYPATDGSDMGNVSGSETDQQTVKINNPNRYPGALQADTVLQAAINSAEGILQSNDMSSAASNGSAIPPTGYLCDGIFGS